MNPDLQEFLDSKAGDIPVMPDIAASVAKAVANPHSSVDQIRAVVELDPAVATHILKMANSAFYGFRREVTGLHQAILLVGRRTIKNLVLAASMRRTFRRFGLLEKLLWEHGSLAGPLAESLARRLPVSVNPDAAFTAGLLHDVGKTVFANGDHDRYELVAARVYNEGMSFREAETEQFGFDHAELGAHVINKWGLPGGLATVVRHHHDGPEALKQLPRDLAEMVAVVSLTTSCLTRLGVGRQTPVESLDLTKLPAWRFLGLTDEDVDDVLAEAHEGIISSRSIAA